MNLTGRLVHSIGIEEKITVEQALITADRISLDWNQDGRVGHLIARSSNGSHYQGRYGYHLEHSDFECELTLFKSKNDDLLYGTWREHDTGRSGTLILRLPARAVATSAPQTADLSAGPSVAPEAAVVQPPAAAPSTIAWTTRPAAAEGPTGPEPAASPRYQFVAPPVASSQADHLLSITAEQLEQQDRGEIEKQLLAAPVSALFKVAHNALAAELRAMAARIFADRNGTVPGGNVPRPAPRPAESPEMRAHKRRSSRHR